MARNFKKSDMKKAIKGSKGIISEVAKNLNCDWKTADTYIKKHNLENMIYVENEINIDNTESKLFENIQDGKEASIFFHLKTKAKHRGYIERASNEISPTTDNDKIDDLINTIKAQDTGL